MRCRNSNCGEPENERLTRPRCGWGKGRVYRWIAPAKLEPKGLVLLTLLLMEGAAVAQIPPVLSGPGPSGPSISLAPEFRGEFPRFADLRERRVLVWDDRTIAYKQVFLRIRREAKRLIPRFQPQRAEVVLLLERILQHTIAMEKAYFALASEEAPWSIPTSLDPVYMQLTLTAAALKDVNDAMDRNSEALNLDLVAECIKATEADLNEKLNLSVVNASVTTKRDGKEIGGYTVKYYWKLPEYFDAVLHKKTPGKRGSFGESSPTKRASVPAGIYSAYGETKEEVTEDQDLVLRSSTKWGNKVEPVLELIPRRAKP